MWQELPSRSSNLLMNVSDLPCAAAISFAAVLYSEWSSAVVITSS